jgi:hypothetical protein
MTDFEDDTPTEADLDACYGSKYPSAIEVGDRKLRTKIARVRKQALPQQGGGTKTKFVLSFTTIDKEMVLNATNKNTLVDELGRKPVHWSDAEVGLYTEPTNMAGKRTSSRKPRLANATILYNKALRLGRMVARDWIAPSEVFDALSIAADACGLNRDDGEQQTRKTIQSGLNGALKIPHPNLSSESAELASESWPTIDNAAYTGLVGEIVQTFLPHTEADPVALLIQTLTAAGNVIGRFPHYRVEADQHRGNLFAVLVGDSAKGRKGISFNRVRSVVQTADETWAGDRIASGLSSGEGLINQVRDPVQKYNPKDACTEIVDPGAADKRLMIVEPEFASAIAVAERPGNTLSPLIRRAWDGDKLVV